MVLRQFRLYLDTSLWNRLGDRESFAARRASFQFLNRACARHLILVSPLVIAEVGNTPDPQERKSIQRLLWAQRPVRLGGDSRAAGIADSLLKEGGFRPSMLVDLTHVGYAVLGRADAVVTWDVRTLAREKVRSAVHAYCRREGLTVPLIGRPEEVAKWLGLRM